MKTIDLSATTAELQQRIVAHMVDRIRTAPPCDEPFPHFFVEQVFPPDVYSQLLRRLPDPQQYEKAYGYENRLNLPLSDSALGALPAEQASTWQAARDALCSPDVKAVVFEKLKRGLAYRFRVRAETVGEIHGYPAPALFREGSGYSITPHPDTRKKIVTMQFALPRDESQIDLGTALYRRSLSPASLSRKPRGFIKVKQFPFLPNSAYAFVVLNGLGLKSWHGREELAEDSGARNTLLNIYGRNPHDEFPRPEAAELAHA